MTINTALIIEGNAAGAQAALDQANRGMRTTGTATSALQREFAGAAARGREIETALSSAARQAAGFSAQIARTPAVLASTTTAAGQARVAFDGFEKELRDTAAAAATVTPAIAGVAPAVAAVGPAMAGSLAGFRNSRFVLQNTAAQLGDIVVQAEAGTPVLRVLGQQVPQLVAGFALFGGAAGATAAVLSVVAAVAFPVAGLLLDIGGGASGASEDMKTFSERLQEQTLDIFSLVEALEALERVADTRNLLQGVPSQVAQGLEPLRQLLESGFAKQLDRDFDAAREAITAGIRETMDESSRELERQRRVLAVFEETFPNPRERGGDLAETAAELDADIAGLASQTVRLGQAMSVVQKIGGDTREEFAESFALAVQRLEAAGLMNDELEHTLFTFAEANGLAGELVRILEDAAGAAAGVPLGLRDAVAQAEAFATAMGRARDATAGIGISAAGIDAQIAALEGGASGVEARVEGAVAERRAQLFAAFPTVGISPTAATQQVAAVESELAEFRAATLAQETARERLAELTRSGSGSGRGGRAERDLAGAIRERIDLLREADPVEREMIKLRDELAGASDGYREVVRALIGEEIRFKDRIDAQADAYDGLRDAAESALDTLIFKGGSARDVVGDLLGLLGRGALFGSGPFGGLFGGGVLGAILPQRRAAGGLIFGPGGPTDDRVPVLASPGEFMTNAAATRRNLPLLEAINAGADFARFANGGLVAGAGVGASAPLRIAAGAGRDDRITVVLDLRNEMLDARIDRRASTVAATTSVAVTAAGIARFRDEELPLVVGRPDFGQVVG